MLKRTLSFLFLFAASVSMAWAASDDVHRFSGTAPGSTGVFRMDGPWTLSWNAASEFPQLAFMEMQLYDAETNRFLGLVAQRDGTGHGERLIPRAGAYRVVVTGRNVDWAVEIEPVSEDLAALIKRRPDIKRVQLVEAGTGVSSELVQSATGWHADGETALLLDTGDARVVRIPFHGGSTCPGLADSHNVFFVTAGYDSTLFNAILLENGMRCYLANPTPALAAPPG